MRVSAELLRAWSFTLGDSAHAADPAFDDSGWRVENLPHSFSLPYFGSPEFYMGYGWYRKTFDVRPEWAGRRISLEFDGVFQVAEVFVNGRRVGEHRGGYTGFRLDITDAVRPGPNVLAVRVNNLWDPSLAPRAGEHVFSGGIYRDVRLVVTDPLHVAWCGTFVTTPRVSRDAAVVRIQTEIVNDADTPKRATVRTEILDAGGQRVAFVDSTLDVGPRATVVFDQTAPPVANPRLWGPDHPHLYTARTTVLEGDRATDEYETPFGIRTIEWTADRGFFLNGEHLYLRGANVHQDHAGWGDAVTRAGMRRDVALMKEAGFNWIRGSHYPHAPAFSDACDKLGMLFWSENVFWGIGGFKPDGFWNASAYPVHPEHEAGFEASLLQQLEEMIRIHRNHPSIFVWSMSNEPFFTAPETLGKTKRLLERCVALSRKLDPTRPAAVGGVQRPLDERRLDLVGDVAGYNGDGASIPEFQNPGVPNVVSEYGSKTAVRPGAYDPGWDHLAKDEGRPVHSWRAGQAIWCGFDHGSIAGDALGRMGIVDYFRIPKRAWYWYRHEYRGIPPPEWPRDGAAARLELTADKTVIERADGSDDAWLLVRVLDRKGCPVNATPVVALTIESGPGEFPTGRSITFSPDSDIAILDGQAAIEFRSYHAGVSRIRAASPGLAESVIEIESRGGPAFEPGVTPLVENRPYVRFTVESKQSERTSFGLNNPTKTSSAMPGHSGGFANDGKPDTWWQAAPDDPLPWWQVDLEKSVRIEVVTIRFPVAAAWRYRVEASGDGQTGWTSVAVARLDAADDSERVHRCSAPVQGRFLRITFDRDGSAPAPMLCEVKVDGWLSS